MHDKRDGILAHPAVGYAMAAVAVTAAFALRQALEGVYGHGLPPYATFFPAVMIVALLLGLGPGLAATAIAAVVAAIWIIEPHGRLTIDRPVDAVGMVMFLGTGALMSAVAELYRRNRKKAVAYAKELLLRESQEQLRQQREWLRVTLTSIGDAVLATDTSGMITFLNPVAQSLTGWSEQEALGQPVQSVFRIINEQTRQAGEDIFQRVLREGCTVALANHMAMLSRDGREIPIEDSAAPIKDGDGRVIGVVLVFHDVTQRRRAAAEMLRLNRTLRALSNSSQAVVRAKDEAGYLKDICRIIVEDCGYSMIWIGWAQNDAAMSVLPAACAGFEEGYLETLKLTWADEERGHGPTGTAIRTGKLAACPNMLTDPRFAPWREQALMRGYASSIALPLMVDGKAMGALTIYCKEPDPFTVSELKLLSELADDVANGVTTLRLREAHRQSEEALQQSEQRVRLKLQSILSPEGDIGRLELGDLIDSQAIQSIMDDFHKVARIPMSIIDLDGKMLVGVGWQEICSRFHRTNPQTCQHCLESDTKLSAGLRPGEFRLYKCKNNMWDIATPIMVAGKHVGNIFSGQFFFDDEVPDRELFRSQARQYGFDEDDYLAALDKVPRLSRQTVDRGMAFFMKLADMLSQLGHSNVKLARLLADREALTASLRQVSEQRRMALESSKAGTWEWNLRTNRNSWSDETFRLYGLEPGAVQPSYEAWRQVVHPQHRAAAEEVVRQTAANGAELNTEFRVNLADGHERWVMSRARPVPDAEGDVERYIGIVVDITERKHAEEALRRTVEELRRSNQELEQFAYVTSHDLQEPLRQVRSFTQLLRDRYGQKLDAKATEFMEFVIEGAGRMSALVQDLLAYSRMGSREARRQPASCQAALKRALANLEMSVSESRAAITHDELPTVTAEPTQLAQLFQNLVGNAVKFRRDDVPPQVHVGCRHDGPDWLLWVKDNGIGIDPQYHQKVFLIFQRLHGREKYAGTGIGLAICKKIVEQHGGRIWIESQAGQGATFFFTLPHDGAAV